MNHIMVLINSRSCNVCCPSTIYNILYNIVIVALTRFSFTNKEFIKNRQDIQFFLKQTFAEIIWGSEARYKVQMLRDHTLLEALDYLSQAEKLLAQAYHLKKAG